MKIVSTSYTNTPAFSDPEQWLDRIVFYTGILEALAQQHQVESIEQINYNGVLERKGVKYHFLNFKKPKLYFPRQLHCYIKKIKPDIIFVNGLIFPLQVIQLRLKLGRGVKIILLHRAEKPFKRFKRYFQKLGDKCVDAYLFTSSDFGENWKLNINVRKIHEVIQASSTFYNMDRTAALEITKVKGTPVFLWVGMLIPRKDPLTVVKAFLEFVRHYPEARLYMIYQSDELLQEIYNLLEKNKEHKDAIVLVGSISHDLLLYWYNSADFFVLASHYEGSGIVVSEAMSCGCIPVTSDFISFQKMTGPGKCGLLFETGNEKDLLAVLLKIHELDIEKERAKVLQQFKDELSFEAIAKKINTVISSF